MKDLEALFEKCAASEAALDMNYEKLTQAGIIGDGLAAQRTESAVSAAAPERARHYTREDLQFYMLRRKYGTLPPVPELERAGAADAETGEPQSAWRDCPPAQLDENELCILTQTLLADGRISLELQQAVGLLAGRPEADGFQRIFFTAWLSLQQGMSKEGRRQLLAQLPEQAADGDAGQRALCLLRSAISSSLRAAERAEALREQGYQNRQEALEQALREAETRYETASRNAANHRY